MIYVFFSSFTFTCIFFSLLFMFERVSRGKGRGSVSRCETRGNEKWEKEQESEREREKRRKKSTIAEKIRRKIHLPFSFVYLLFLSSVTSSCSHLCVHEQLSMTRSSTWILKKKKKKLCWYLFGSTIVVVKIAQTFTTECAHQLHTLSTASAFHSLACIPFCLWEQFICASCILNVYTQESRQTARAKCTFHSFVPILALWLILIYDYKCDLSISFAHCLSLQMHTHIQTRANARTHSRLLLYLLFVNRMCLVLCDGAAAYWNSLQYSSMTINLLLLSTIISMFVVFARFQSGALIVYILVLMHCTGLHCTAQHRTSLIVFAIIIVVIIIVVIVVFDLIYSIGINLKWPFFWILLPKPSGTILKAIIPIQNHNTHKNRISK